MQLPKHNCIKTVGCYKKLNTYEHAPQRLILKADDNLNNEINIDSSEISRKSDFRQLRLNL